MKNLLYIILSTILIILISCSNKDKKMNDEKQKESKREKYAGVMNRQHIVMKLRGPCKDALQDTLHKRNVPYVDSMLITDSAVSINFGFKEACCQEFMGFYGITKDSALVFGYTEVSEEACTCICWYKYNIYISKLPFKPKMVRIAPLKESMGYY